MTERPAAKSISRERADDSADARRGAPPGDVPNEAEVEEEFEHTDADSLREAKDLTDDEGDDIRRYTGEPVPTEHGNVIPQQMAVGHDAVVGDGEWPEEPPRGGESSDT
jgi:hypothetical protein